MKIEFLGEYLDRTSGRSYVVKKITHQTNHSTLTGSASRSDGSYEFQTSCGIDLKPMNDELSAFELIQIDGVIHRIEA
ncbi:MAG: hypothetical protein RL571_3067 [Pseudomonadota bacterium]|jgi:hypothetical protein